MIYKILQNQNEKIGTHKTNEIFFVDAEKVIWG